MNNYLPFLLRTITVCTCPSPLCQNRSHPSREAHKALHDDLARHRSHRGTGEARGQQRNGKDQTGSPSKQGCEGQVSSVDISHIPLSMSKEGGCCHIEHRHIDESR